MRRFRLPRKIAATALASSIAAGFIIAATTAPASATDKVDIPNCLWDQNVLFGPHEYAAFTFQNPTSSGAGASICYKNAGDTYFATLDGDHFTGTYHDQTGRFTFHSGNNAGWLVTAETDHPAFADYQLYHFDKNQSIDLGSLYIYGIHIN